MNKVILIGNLGKDPDVRQVNESNVASFTLATTTGYGDNKKTQWHSVTLWGKQADVAKDYLHKGSKVAIVGEINYREYEKDGVKRTFTEIVGREMYMLSPKDDKADDTISQEAIQSVMPSDELPF